MKKHRVNVDGVDYNVCIEPKDDVAANDESLDFCLELTKAEYEHSVKRRDRLDTKINILVAVSLIVFPTILGALNKKELNDAFYSKNILGINLASGCIYIFAVIIFLAALIWLIKLLLGDDVQRINVDFLENSNCYNDNSKELKIASLSNYNKAIRFDQDRITKRFRQFGYCAYAIVAALVLSIVAETLYQ